MSDTPPPAPSPEQQKRAAIVRGIKVVAAAIAGTTVGALTGGAGWAAGGLVLGSYYGALGNAGVDRHINYVQRKWQGSPMGKVTSAIWNNKGKVIYPLLVWSGVSVPVHYVKETGFYKDTVTDKLATTVVDVAAKPYPFVVRTATDIAEGSEYLFNKATAAEQWVVKKVRSEAPKETSQVQPTQQPLAKADGPSTPKIRHYARQAKIEANNG